MESGEIYVQNAKSSVKVRKSLDSLTIHWPITKEKGAPCPCRVRLQKHLLSYVYQRGGCFPFAIPLNSQQQFQLVLDMLAGTNHDLCLCPRYHHVQPVRVEEEAANGFDVILVT